jgi:hypothetical protein
MPDARANQAYSELSGAPPLSFAWELLPKNAIFEKDVYGVHLFMAFD